MLNQAKVDMLVGLVKRGMLSIDQIVDQDYKAAVQRALDDQTA